MNTPVSLEIAKLLKEKGFEEKTLLCYDKCDMLASYVETVFKPKNYNTSGYVFSAPTIAEVVMWLYEKHRIWIDANFLPNVDKFSYIAKPMDFKKPKEFSSYKDYYAATSKFIAKSKYDSPTEAYLQAIEYTLKNLI